MSAAKEISRDEAISNIKGYVAKSPERIAILEGVRRKKTYKEMAKKTSVTDFTASRILNKMKTLGLVTGKSGTYQQTKVVKTVNIQSVVREVLRGSARATSAKAIQQKIKVVKVKVPDIEKVLDNLKVERVIQTDCFPLRKPYRKDVGEAYLTLEDMIKDELNIQNARNMMDVINQARAKGLFQRADKGEEDGLNQLFNASALWLRNPSHHKKDKIPKEDALKMILFADYLIKLVRKQKSLNKTK